MLYGNGCRRRRHHFWCCRFIATPHVFDLFWLPWFKKKVIHTHFTYYVFRLISLTHLIHGWKTVFPHSLSLYFCCIHGMCKTEYCWIFDVPATRTVKYAHELCVRCVCAYVFCRQIFHVASYTTSNWILCGKHMAERPPAVVARFWLI